MIGCGDEFFDLCLADGADTGAFARKLRDPERWADPELQFDFAHRSNSARACVGARVGRSLAMPADQHFLIVLERSIRS